MKILLTGQINIGKSTIIEKTVYNKNFELEGFLTYKGPIINNYYNTYIKDINQPNIFLNEYKIVDREFKSKVYPDVFDKVGMEILNKIELNKNTLVVFDEIGSIESKSNLFKYKLIELLKSNINFVGVIKEKNNSFLNEIMEFNFIDFYKVTEENRDELTNIVNNQLINLKEQIKKCN